MTQKTRKSCTYWIPLYPGKSLLESKGGSIRICDIQKYLTWLKLQECKQFLCLKTPKKYAHQIPLYFRSHCWKNNMFSFQIEASHLHIGPKWLCQPEIGYTTLHFFQINTLTITWTLNCSSTMVGGHKKQSNSNTTATYSSALASAVSADWDIAPPLQNIRVREGGKKHLSVCVCVNIIPTFDILRDMML